MDNPEPRISLDERIALFALGLIGLIDICIIQRPKTIEEKRNVVGYREVSADYVRTAFSGERKYPGVLDLIG